MIVVQDIIQDVEQVTGRCDTPYLFRILSRAVDTLTHKACATDITFDPMKVYLDLPVQQDYYVFLPYFVEKPLAVNINGQPSFSHSSLYEFTMNGPGSNDLEAGFQWQDRLTSPIQRRFPRGGNLTLTATSDSEADSDNVTLQVKIRYRNRNDGVITLGVAPAGSPPAPSIPVWDVLEVVKPVTVGTVTLRAGPYVLAHYYPNVTFPEFSCIKLSQKAVEVRMLVRRKTLDIASMLDVIPLNSKQAVICQCQAIKYQDEVHMELAAPFEQQAVTYLNEEQAARNQYQAAAANSQLTTALNLTIGQRDVVVVADIYDDACRIFGQIGRQKVFDKITATMEILFNKCMYWDGLMGLVTLRPDDDYYVALPRYVDTILALNVNRTPGSYKSPWYEFSYAGLGEFNDLIQNRDNWVPWPQLANTQGSVGQFPNVAGCSPVRINGSNRLARGWEEVGTTALAFRLKGPAQLYALPTVGQDSGARITVYGYYCNEPVLNSRGQWGVEIPCYSNRTVPCKFIFDRIDRVTKDPSYSFITLFGVNPFGPQVAGMPAQTDFLAMYWPWDTEPEYRLIRIGVMCKRVLLRYKKNWTKISQLTDPLHIRSRVAMILAMTGVATFETGGSGSASSPFQPTAPVTIANDQIDMAVTLLDDEWRARNPNATIGIQWNPKIYGNAFPQVG